MRCLSWLILAGSIFALGRLEAPAAEKLPEGKVSVEILEGLPDKSAWDLKAAKPAERYTAPAFGFVGTPTKYSSKGHVLDRDGAFVVRAEGTVSLPAGEHRLLLRSRNAARLFLDGKVVVQTAFINPNASGHEKVPEDPSAHEKGLTPLPIGHQEKIVPVTLKGGKHLFRVEAMVGGKRLRPEIGHVFVGIAGKGESFQLLGPKTSGSLTPEGWGDYCDEQVRWLEEFDRVTRLQVTVAERRYWDGRHEIARQEWAKKPVAAVPEVSPQTQVVNGVDHFIGKKLEEARVQPAPLTGDYAFLRRVTLDTVGVIPSREEIEAFQKDRSPDRRARAIDRLLADPRWADHWVGYWQDVLGENPGILKPTLNNTGPFRWWLHQAFSDNLPMDRFATELVMMEGSALGGAPAGFAMATENDVPMAAKAHVLSKAFLGVEMQCARCHDAPFRLFKQEQTFNFAAMLARKPIKLPKTSTVPLREGARKPNVEISLKPGQSITPEWPFADFAPSDLPEGILRKPGDSRERLAALLTSPRNERFAEVIVNRLWQRYLGWGLVDPVDDWHQAQASHPELLRYLAGELVTNNYDLKHVARLILSSHAYQREARDGRETAPEASERLFASPARRRMTAEQMVDSLFVAAGKRMLSEELSMDPEGRRPPKEMLSLGRPQRAWEMTSLSNERDRPALALPVAQSIVDLLAIYGWRDSRPNPITVREETPTPLQPLLLANGVVGNRITRLSDDSAFTKLAVKDLPLMRVTEGVFLQVLSRPPTATEQRMLIDLLEEGYADRLVPGAKARGYRRSANTAAVSWSNHLSPEATRIKLELERLAREGDPPTGLLRSEWRERMEDAVWALVNSPEFVFVP